MEQLQTTTKRFTRTRAAKHDVLRVAVENPALLVRELCNRSFYRFVLYFWPEYSSEEFVDNFHIKLLCDELQHIAENVANGVPKEYDLIINVPPSSSKTAICSIMFPAWLWTRWYWMKIICLSYSGDLSLESAEYSRDIIKSDRFKMVYPELEIKADKDAKGNYRVVKKVAVNPGKMPQIRRGGNRFSTSVGAKVTGYHGHILIWDDPIDPKGAFSTVELESTNRWLSQTFFSRKVNHEVAVAIGIMQRLRENDPSGFLMERKKNIKNICLPGELIPGKSKINPPELAEYYQDGLLDPVRMPRRVLKEKMAEYGQYGYAGQILQDPTPPTGGMFKVDKFVFTEVMPHEVNIVRTIRYWDKAGTKERADGKEGGAFTVGVKMHLLRNDKWLISDVVRGHWEADEREQVIRSYAEVDGQNVEPWVEQEPGSGGKESAQNTIKNLAGYAVNAERPQGDKVYRADPYSVQVNWGNIILLKGDWNKAFIEEHRLFPKGRYKDQVDAAGAAFAQLTLGKQVEVL